MNVFKQKNTPKIELLSSRAIQMGFLTSSCTSLSFLSLEISGEIFIRSHFNPGTQKVSLLFLKEQRAPLLNLNCLGSGEGGEKRWWLERFRFAVTLPSALCSGSAFSLRRRGSCVPEAGPKGNITPGTCTASLVVVSHSVLSSVVGNHMRWLFIGLFFR